jgi:micrococcal nuclease
MIAHFDTLISLTMRKILIFLLLFPALLFSQDFYLCTRVVDGDTIIVSIDGRKERVRLIGVDTPETKHPNKPVEYFGREASAFTKHMVEGKKVNLEYDWQKRDKYGRLLAYVFLEDGTFLNAEIIKQGYGFAYTRFPFKFLDEFRRYEREARKANKGLWRE